MSQTIGLLLDAYVLNATRLSLVVNALLNYYKNTYTYLIIQFPCTYAFNRKSYSVPSIIFFVYHYSLVWWSTPYGSWVSVFWVDEVPVKL